MLFLREPLCPLVPRSQLALLRMGNFPGFTRRREEKVQMCTFEGVFPGLKQALTLLFSPGMGSQTQATCTLLQE